MIRATLKPVLLGAAMVLALAGAAFGRGPTHTAPTPLSPRAPVTLAPFALARILAASPPDVLVIALDESRRPLRGAMPASAFGRDDAALVANAPQHGRIVLAARDLVRVDRVARRLMATGRSVQVLEGGVDAWDRAMSVDPPAPAAAASADVRARYAFDLALRRAFGDPNVAPAAPVRAVAPPPATAGGARSRREGC